MTHDLKALKTITVAGAPFSTAGYRYLYEKVKRDVHLASPAGGTDPMASLVSGNPIAPVWPGEIQARGLGIRVEDVRCGRPTGAGRPGGDGGDDAVPVDASRISGTTLTANGFEPPTSATIPACGARVTGPSSRRAAGILIHGRSDSTLKAKGVRIGTAEIYRQLERMEEIADSVVVEQEWQGRYANRAVRATTGGRHSSTTP